MRLKRDILRFKFTMFRNMSNNMDFFIEFTYQATMGMVLVKGSALEPNKCYQNQIYKVTTKHLK
jgi:hypothetical protein